MNNRLGMQKMSKFKKCLVGFIILYACSRDIDGIRVPAQYAETIGVDPILAPYVKSFYADAKRFNAELRPITVPVFFVRSLEKDIIGKCYRFTPLNWIVISRYFWDRTQPESRQILIYHELGHCVLGKGHEEYGIMQPVLLLADEYYHNKEGILREFFTGPLK